MNRPSFVRPLSFVVSLLLQLSVLGSRLRGAPGDLDFSFDPGSGIDGTVKAVALQPDGKFIIGGDFIAVRGLARSSVARLNADGSGDSSFNLGTVGYDGVFAVALQPDGKVLVGHRYGIARHHADGSLDTSFHAVLTAFDNSGEARVVSIAVQPDGKIVAGGNFITFGARWNFGVVRLLADGSVDASFNAQMPYFEITSVAVQPDGKVLVGGFGAYESEPNSMHRLNADGSHDDGFHYYDPPGGWYNLVRSVVVQPDGKILVAGDFLDLDNTNRGRIARLNSDGTIDGGFDLAIGYSVSDVALGPNGKVLICGTLEGGCARLNADGTLDTSFVPDTGGNFGISSVTVQSDGRVIFTGSALVNGSYRYRMARLQSNGNPDASFDAGRALEGPIESVLVQANGKLLLGSQAFENNGHQYASNRLNADGSRDDGFVPDQFYPVVPAGIMKTVPLPDGRVLVAGYTVVTVDQGDGDYYNVAIPYLTRVFADGSADPTWNWHVTWSDGYSYPRDTPIFATTPSVVVQPDGKILFGGDFLSLNGVHRFGLARLNANGILDATFVPALSHATAIALQPDGKILVGAYEKGIGRLNTNGSLDGSFNPGTGVNGAVYALALQPDGKVLAGGLFTAVNGTSRNNLARLNANGSLDSSFNPGTGPNGAVRAIALRPDGNILVCGGFTMVDGVLRLHVARLYGDSVTPFMSWAASFGLNGAAAAFTADPDHDGISNGVEFVLGGNPVVPTSPRAPLLQRTFSGGNLILSFGRVDASENAGVVLGVEVSTDLANWSTYIPIGANTQTSGPGVIVTENGADPDLISVTIPAGSSPSKFARLKVAF